MHNFMHALPPTKSTSIALCPVELHIKYYYITVERNEKIAVSKGACIRRMHDLKACAQANESRTPYAPTPALHTHWWQAYHDKGAQQQQVHDWVSCMAPILMTHSMYRYPQNASLLPLLNCQGTTNGGRKG
jgi:hypothetical protein